MVIPFVIPNGVSTSGASTFSGALTVSGTATITSAPAINALPTTTVGVGVAGTGVTAAEYGNGSIHKTVLTFALTGDNDYDFADSADHGSGKEVYLFPDGCIILLGATSDALATSDVHMTGAYNMGIGTAQCDDDDVLATTEQDIIPTTSVTQGTTQSFQNQLATPLVIDGTTAAAIAYLNVGVPDASTDAATTVAVTGTATLVWVNAGDY